MLNLFLMAISVLILMVVLLGLLDLALFLYRKIKDKCISLFKRKTVEMEEVKADVPVILQETLKHKSKAR